MATASEIIKKYQEWTDSRPSLPEREVGGVRMALDRYGRVRVAIQKTQVVPVMHGFGFTASVTSDAASTELDRNQARALAMWILELYPEEAPSE